MHVPNIHKYKLTTLSKSQWLDYLELCKPKVVALMLLTTVVGMLMATPPMIPLSILLAAPVGIGLIASAGAVTNHLLERNIDSKMTRTETRPIASGRIKPTQALLFALSLTLLGSLILLIWVNGLTTLLTLATVIGYAGIYTNYLKHATAQNIVIGGLAGAMPPLLGWASVTGHITGESLLLVLIIFTWTPPHFWALAIYRYNDYAKAKIPMLPVIYGIPYTKLSILLYTILLIVITILPFVVGMSGWLYLATALLLGTRFLYWSTHLLRTNDRLVAKHTFQYSIRYLMILFTGLLFDHYLIL